MDPVIRGTAVRAEQLGYDSVWVSDHVVVPKTNVVNFGETVFDPLITLGVIAGATSRVRLGTTVLMSSIVFSFQRYFEYQIEQARKISQ